jgi:hypothetical protein
MTYKVIVWRPTQYFKIPVTVAQVEGNDEQEAIQAWAQKAYGPDAELEWKIDHRGFWRFYDEANLPIGEPFFLFEVEEGKKS